MNDRQLEKELSELYSSTVDEGDFDALAEKVWKRNRRYRIFLNCAIAGAAILGSGLSFLVISSFELVPSVLADLNIYQPLIGNQWIVALGIPIALLASLWISSFARE